MRIPALFLILLSLTACGPALPKLPDIDFTRFQPAVREAIEKAHASAELAPQDPRQAAAVGKVLHAHGLLDQAAVFYQHARKLEPQDFSHAHLLGVALSERGKHSDALEVLNAALAIKGDSPATKFALAESLLASGGTVLAGETFRSLGNHPVAHLGLGRTLQGEEALAQYQKALALAPRYGAAWKALADLYRAMSQPEKADEAERAFNRHREEAPLIDDPEMATVRELNVSTPGLLSRARQAAAQSRLSDAVRLYEQVLLADPDNDAAAASLMGLQIQLKDIPGAEKTYENAQRRKRESGELQFRYGQLLAATGRLAEAKGALEKALQQEPNRADAWFELGKLHDAAGAKEKAFELYGRGLFIDPANYKERFYGARILAAQGRTEPALTLMKQALASPVDDETVVMKQALAGVYVTMKRPELAIAELREARQTAVARSLSAAITAIDAELARLGAKP